MKANSVHSLLQEQAALGLDCLVKKLLNHISRRQELATFVLIGVLRVQRKAVTTAIYSKAFIQIYEKHLQSGSNSLVSWELSNCQNEMTLKSILWSHLLFISYLPYQQHCCALPDKRCLSHGMLPLSGHDDVALFEWRRQWHWINTEIKNYVIIASLKSV